MGKSSGKAFEEWRKVEDELPDAGIAVDVCNYFYSGIAYQKENSFWVIVTPNIFPHKEQILFWKPRTPPPKSEK